MKEINKQYTCPKCGAGGAGPNGPYLCHVCKDKVIMKESHNGVIKEKNVNCTK